MSPVARLKTSLRILQLSPSNNKNCFNKNIRIALVQIQGSSSDGPATQGRDFCRTVPLSKVTATSSIGCNVMSLCLTS